MIKFKMMNVDENRENNTCVRKIKSFNGGKCCICEKQINTGEEVVRINLYGINRNGITLCFDCIDYLQHIVTNFKKGESM